MSGTLEYPSNLPGLHKYLKERLSRVQKDLEKNITTLYQTPDARGDLLAIAILKDRIEREVLTLVVGDLRRQSTAGNQNPTVRLRLLKANVQDRLFETIGLAGSLMSQALEGEKAKAYREMIRIIDHVITATERAE